MSVCSLTCRAARGPLPQRCAADPCLLLCSSGRHAQAAASLQRHCACPAQHRTAGGLAGAVCRQARHGTPEMLVDVRGALSAPSVQMLSPTLAEIVSLSSDPSSSSRMKQADTDLMPPAQVYHLLCWEQACPGASTLHPMTTRRPGGRPPPARRCLRRYTSCQPLRLALWWAVSGTECARIFCCARLTLTDGATRILSALPRQLFATVLVHAAVMMVGCT